jgi:hypothetical protein
VYLCVPYDANNKQPLFHYTAFTDLPFYRKQGLVTYFWKPKKYSGADDFFHFLTQRQQSAPFPHNTPHKAIIWYYTDVLTL